MTEADKMLFNAQTAEETKEALAAGADVNAKGKDGWTALMVAETAEQTKLLLAAGADVNAKNKRRWTALMFAKTAEQTKLLLAAGADVNAKDEDGYTALMNARTAEQTKLLLAAGANVNAKNRWGNTALLSAVRSNNIERMKLLIEKGADVNAKNKEGKTVLDYADIKQTELIKQVIMKQHEKIEETKERIKSTPRLTGKSGVVFADAIANMIRSGKIKGDVTPEMAKKLKAQWMKDMASNGKK